jgi:hypothetical protein
MNIIESCLFVIIACTWTVQHLNLPILNEKPWQIRFRKVLWASITLLFPEFILAHSILERHLAVQSLEAVGKLPHESRPSSWTLTHSYYANMGGILDSECSLPMNVEQLIALLTSRVIDQLPDIPLAEITDRSKSDIFSKILTLNQITWLAVGLLVRAIRHYAVSQLEILTLAFAASTLLTYLFCWDKPQDVMTAKVAQISDKNKLPELMGGELKTLQADRIVTHLLHPNQDWKKDLPLLKRVPNDNFKLSNSVLQPVGVVLAVITVSLPCCTISPNVFCITIIDGYT